MYIAVFLILSSSESEEISQVSFQISSRHHRLRSTPPLNLGLQESALKLGFLHQRSISKVKLLEEIRVLYWT